MEHNSTYDTVVISTVSLCPTRYQLLSALLYLNLGDMDCTHSEAEVIDASTPILCTFTSLLSGKTENMDGWLQIVSAHG